MCVIMLPAIHVKYVGKGVWVCVHIGRGPWGVGVGMGYYPPIPLKW